MYMKQTITTEEVGWNADTEIAEVSVVHLQDWADIFLEHNWLVKHNPEVDWNSGKIKFTRCPHNCWTNHQEIDISHKIRSIQTNEDLWEEEDEPDPNTPDDLPEYIWPFTHLFNKTTFDKLPEWTEWDHAIELTEDAPKEIDTGTYNMTIKEQDELKAFVKENLESGRIRPLKSPFAAPMFFIPKKDGSKQLVQDYHKLNRVTVKDKSPLPRINEVIDKLGKAKYFNKLDIIWEYNNVRIKEGDEWKAAFLTNEGLFKPTVMYFGLCNSPRTFSLGKY